MYKLIEDYENYSISDTGRVINTKYNRELTVYIDNQGYGNIDLFKEGKGKRFLVHRLVAKAFLENPDNKPCVNHKDSDRRNNNIENLEWVTNKENLEHRDLKEHKGKISKRRVMKLFKSKRKWDSAEEFLVEIMKS